PYASQLVIPLRSDENTLGTIHFAKSSAKAFSIEDLRIGYLLALQLTLAMRNALVLEELKQARDELQKRNEELDAYNHTIAHDLKTPLQAITTFSQLLLMKHERDFDDKSKGYVKYIGESVGKMGQMIDQLLWLARLRNAVQASQPIAIKPIAEAATAR